ncbi:MULTISPECIES: hypothetical protein [Pantoea]|jgi:hypothetical protein|uniref:Uncharacterized protein n=1 Tax=Pantoea endophytica TaxID=92488 RepID=A0ABX4SXI3_9GAMM|nr:MULTISPECIES: hypothetical protein [Pantoea]MRT26936.1 hypothetical protein [Enterobacteriaceae bacterium RIT697]PLR26360.1 hypothetical protein PZBJ_06135 [Pantoea endophytica]
MTQLLSDVLTPALSHKDSEKIMKSITSFIEINQMLRPAAWLFVTAFSLGAWFMAGVIIQIIF